MFWWCAGGGLLALLLSFNGAPESLLDEGGLARFLIGAAAAGAIYRKMHTLIEDRVDAVRDEIRREMRVDEAFRGATGATGGAVPTRLAASILTTSPPVTAQRDATAPLSEVEGPDAPTEPVAETPRQSPWARSDDAVDADGDAPSGPTPLEALWNRAAPLILGGNPVVRVGLAILFVGLAFLASYAASAGLFPVEMRLALVGGVGIGLVGFGFARRAERPEVALVIQGTGVAALYLTTYAAARGYGLVDPVAAFGLMALFAALGAALAMLQRSQPLALAAFAGGYAVPLLLGGSGANPTPLFVYVTLLNIAVLVIAVRQAWRWLNLLACVATFAIAGAYWASGGAVAHPTPSALFLAATMVVMLATALLYGRAGHARLDQAVQASLLFGPALGGFALAMPLVEGREFGAAMTALAFAALYVGAALLAIRRSHNPMLGQGFAALALGFATLAVPLALDARWTSGVWALEGLGALWVGRRQGRWVGRTFGLALQLAAAVSFFQSVAMPVVAPWPLANAFTLGALVAALPLLVSSYWLGSPPAAPASSRIGARYEQAVEPDLPGWLFGLGYLLIAFALWGEVFREWPVQEPVIAGEMRSITALLALLLGQMLLSAWVGARLHWPLATVPARGSTALLAAGAFAFSIGEIFSTRGIAGPEGLLMLTALLLHGVIVWREERDAQDPAWRLGIAHTVGVWVLIGLLLDLAGWAIDQAEGLGADWDAIVPLVTFCALLAGVTRWSRAERSRGQWPLRLHADTYRRTVATPLAALAGLGAVWVAVDARGDTAPLPYVPLLNPVDLAALLGLAAVAMWWTTRDAEAVADEAPTDRRTAMAVGGVLLLTVLSGAWLRVAHHLFGIEWDGSMMADGTVEAGLSILWALAGLALMLLGHRRAQRDWWMAGAALVGLVVVKLLMVDLSHQGSGARIIAFIAVGGLMLAIGYVAPIPARRALGEEMA